MFVQEIEEIIPELDQEWTEGGFKIYINHCILTSKSLDVLEKLEKHYNI